MQLLWAGRLSPVLWSRRLAKIANLRHNTVDNLPAGLRISVPTVTACGLQDFRGGIEGEPMIRAFMTVVWALHEATADDKIRLIQTVHAHKTEECRFESLHWWSRSCNSDREASVIVEPDAAAKRKRQCYAYLGGGQLSLDHALASQDVAHGSVRYCGLHLAQPSIG